MTQFVAFDKEVEVNGTTIMSVIDGMGAFRSMAERFLAESGLPDDIKPDDQSWYSQQEWLNTFKLIAQKVGPNTLTSIGKKIPENAVFPPDVDNIVKGLAAIDVAYHINHRKDGKILFNPEDGSMGKGIGHYHFEKIENKNLVEMVCENPYPCDFDKGIIIAMAQKFNPTASVAHDDSAPCRKNGANSCTYHVSWRN